MSWRVVVYGLAGIGGLCVTCFGSALAYLGLLEFGMWRRRNQDRPIPHDDTWTRFESAANGQTWTSPEFFPLESLPVAHRELVARHTGRDRGSSRQPTEHNGGSSE